MLLERRFAAAATARVLIAGGLFTVLATTMVSTAQAASGDCADAAQITVLPSPLAPWTGAPLRVMVVAEKPVEGTLSLVAPNGSVAAKSADRHGASPYSWLAEVAAPTAGTWHATLTLDRASADCSPVSREIAVVARKPEPLRTPPGSIWQVRASWNSTTEALFSAWIEKLFDAPADQDLSWKAWHEVLRDPSRNFLFDYLGRNEDKAQTGLRPDCADFVYFLRAYFAYKMGLPFGYSNCSRGAAGKPPKCYQWFDVEHPEVTRPAPPPEQEVATATPDAPAAPAPTPGLLGLFNRSQSADAATSPAPAAKPAKPQPKRPTNFGEYVRDVGDVVHTGAVRVLANDDATDFYTIALTPQSLRPGTVYADPYGHVLMLVHLVPEQNGKPGVFLAVDAEPDGSITRKRFWRGNFLFVHDASLGSPGFKRFRPILRGDKNGPLRRLSNADIGKNPQYGDFSLDQSQISVEDFYDRMDDVMSPDPLDPVKAMTDAIVSLYEQVKIRVTSVENGRKYQEKSPGETAMPNGPSIFETTGAWEDYSTPARDFRLLIAMDVVRGFPDRVQRRADRYAMPAGKSAAELKSELQGVLASELASRKITYTRSDGSPWTLTLKEVVDRAVDFEMAYNPNDCAELRWAAPAGSEEAATCKRRAPEAQRAKMGAEYRAWFRERHWPTHG
jgi:hypothetical protein